MTLVPMCAVGKCVCSRNFSSHCFWAQRISQHENWHWHQLAKLCPNSRFPVFNLWYKTSKDFSLRLWRLGHFGWTNGSLDCGGAGMCSVKRCFHRVLSMFILIHTHILLKNIGAVHAAWQRNSRTWMNIGQETLSPLFRFCWPCRVPAEFFRICF